MSQLANRVWLAVSLCVLVAFAYPAISDMVACSDTVVPQDVPQVQVLATVPAAAQQPSADEVALLLRQAQETRKLIAVAAASNDPELAAIAGELASIGWKSYVHARTRAGYRPDDSRTFSTEVSEAWHACSNENASKLVNFRLAAQGKVAMSASRAAEQIERNRVYRPLGSVARKSTIVLPEP